MNGIEAATSGRLAKDPTMRTTRNGSAMLSFSIAVDEPNNTGDERQTTWVNVSVFGQTAQALAETLHKGDRVYLEGRLSMNGWTGADGKERHGLSVMAWRVEKLGQIGKNRPKSSGRSKQGPSSAPTGNGAPPWDPAWQAPLDDDIGF